MILILNDLHLSVQRQAGTTPVSQEALRNYLFDSLRKVLDETEARTLFVNGDLFDTFEVSARDWTETHNILRNWLEKDKRRGMVLSAGNHDTSPRGNRMSAFKMLCAVLDYTGQVSSLDINEWHEFEWGAVLAHCANQEIFNLKLKEIASQIDSGDLGTKRLFVHANFDNGYATQSDHSLNMTRDDCRAFNDKGVQVFFGHDHHPRVAMDGGVVILGNQFPSSISDCLGDPVKCLHVITDTDEIEIGMTWGHMEEDGYIEMDWHSLRLDSGRRFIRVSGDATVNEASDVINAIAKFRSKSDAFVISNAVAIDGIIQDDKLPETFTDMRSFDTMAFITDHLDPDEVVIVERLRGMIAND